MAADVRSRARRVRRGAFLYRRLLVQQLKAVLEYQAQFWILVGGAALTQGIGYVFIWAVFRQVPRVQGWRMWDVVVMYALVFVTEGFVSLFFEGMWQLGFKVNRGDFDYYLVRPVSPVIQLLTCDVGMNGLGNVVVGGALIAQALVRGGAHLTLGQGGLALLLLLCAIAIRTSISLAANALGFWTQSPNNSAPLMVHNLSDFGMYPLTVYSLWLRPLIIAAIPYAFVSFFPAAYVFDRGVWAKAALLAPVVALYAALAALWV